MRQSVFSAVVLNLRVRESDPNFIYFIFFKTVLVEINSRAL